MRYLNEEEFFNFQAEFKAMLKKHAKNVGIRHWGYPSGITACGSYFINTSSGNMFIGYSDDAERSRWWIPIGVDQVLSDYDLQIAFEMRVPFRSGDKRLSVHYALDDNNLLLILHKGRFAVSHGVKMAEFFKYYRENPGSWELLHWNNYVYVVLGKVNIALSDTEFFDLVESLSEFAHYITEFKTKYRRRINN